MATIAQVQKAAARFLDEQIAGAFSGWDQTLVCGTGALLAAGIPKLLHAYEKHPIVAAAIAIGVYDPVNKVVDLDMAYSAYSPFFKEDKFPVRIPFINKTIKIGKNEIDTFVRYIKEA